MTTTASTYDVLKMFKGGFNVSELCRCLPGSHRRTRELWRASGPRHLIIVRLLRYAIMYETTVDGLCCL